MKLIDKRIPIVIFISLTILYILFGYGVTISNDSVTNVDQIVGLDLLNRSSHFSFHLFGIIFYLVFSKLIGLSVVTSIQLMLALISATASISLYLITLKKYENRKIALFTVVIYAIASGIFRFSCQVEYLVLVPSLGLISLYFYSREHYIIAGILFAFGMMTSLLAILFLPMFLLFTSLKEVFKKKNILFALSLISIYLAINIFTYKEAMSGNWSYGQQLDLYKQIFGEINFLRPISIYIYGYLRSFNILIFALPFTIYFLYKSNRELYYLLIITLVIHLPLAIPEARYGGYQMTTYPIIAISVAYLFNKLFHTHKIIVLVSIIIYSVINVYLVYSERTFYRDLKETYIELNNNLEKNSILIVYQAVKPIKTVYATNLQVYNLHSDYQNDLAEKYYNYVPTNLTTIINNNKEVYILESGVSIPDDYLKLMFANFTKNQGAKVKGFALNKILEIDPSIKFEKLNNYPLDVYRINK